MIKQIRSSYGDNYSYVIYDEHDGRAVLIDPVAHEEVKRFLLENDLTPEYLVNTHGHGDHTQGNQVFHQEMGSKIVAHSRAASAIGKVDRKVEDGDKLEIGNIQLEVIYTPGHTSGSICLRGADSLFSGDTVFLAGCGNPKFGGDARELFRSIKQKIVCLPDYLELYPGHDYAVKNLEFALHIEPDNQFATSKLDEIKASRMQNNEPSSTLGEE
ncbi:MAG: MBL fold metallo-hydrolase, partial [bacterium]